MLFAQKVLAPGPQLKHPGNVNPVLDTGPPAQRGVYLKEIKNAIHAESLSFWEPTSTFSAREVRQRTPEFASGSGFVFNQVHNIQPQVPPENILRMFETRPEIRDLPDSGLMPARRLAAFLTWARNLHII